MATLTDWDRKLLARHLAFYQGLASGARPPTTEAQRHFVAVFQAGLPPRTQHEIAYHRYLQVERPLHAAARQRPFEPPRRPEAPADAEPVAAASRRAARRPEGSSSATSSSGNAEDWNVRAEQTIDAIEEVELMGRLGRQAARLLDGVKANLRRRPAVSSRLASQLALWISPLTADAGWSSSVRDWMGDSFNTLSNAYTQAMDRDWLEGRLKAASFEHRLHDGGHTILGSFGRVREAVPDDTLVTEIWNWMRAYASDFSSPAGMPVVTISQETYATLEAMLQALGIPPGWTLDALHVNLEELIAAIVPGLAVLLNWSKAEQADFHRSLGSLAVAAGVAASPLGVLVLVVGAARVFHQNRRGGEGAGSFARAFTEGGAISGVVVTTGALVGGPVWIGMVAGIVLAMMLRRARHRVDPARLAEGLRDLLKTWVMPSRTRAAPA